MPTNKTKIKQNKQLKTISKKKKRPVYYYRSFLFHPILKIYFLFLPIDFPTTLFTGDKLRNKISAKPACSVEK